MKKPGPGLATAPGGAGKAGRTGTVKPRPPNAMVRFLAGFCREHPLDEKIFIVPSFIVGRQIGEALARQVGSWVNLRFVTPWTLAGEVLERRAESDAGKPMTSSAELALTDRLFRDLHAGGKLEYFGRAGVSLGLSNALYRAIRDLRLAGLTSADVRPERFLVERKGRELALLVGRYERALEEDGLLDSAAFLAAAVRAAERTSFAPALTLCPMDARLSRLERDLVRAAAGNRLVLIPGDPVFGLERPRHSWPASPPGEAAEAKRLSWLFAPREALDPGEDNRIEIFRALGPANECREVLRRLYSESVPFDHVEVLVPPGGGHATIFHLLSARTRLPVTFGEGVPVSFTSPGRLFFGLLDWLENDFSSAHLCRLLENGDLVLPAGRSGIPLAARTACRYLRSAMIGWGRERYRGRLEALREARKADLGLRENGSGGEEGGVDEPRRAALSTAIAEIDALAAAIGRLLTTFPDEAAPGAYNVEALCEALSGLIGDPQGADTEIDRKARDVLLDRLTVVRQESRFPPLPIKEALDLIRSAGASLRVGASPPLPGHLHVTGFSTGGHSGRPTTFVVGLDEATFPGRGLQDPVLLDEERAALSDDLPTAADALRANLYGLAATLASVRGRVVFSYPSFNVVEGRESSRPSGSYGGSPTSITRPSIGNSPKRPGSSPEEQAGPSMRSTGGSSGWPGTIRRPTARAPSSPTSRTSPRDWPPRPPGPATHLASSKESSTSGPSVTRSIRWPGGRPSCPRPASSSWPDARSPISSGTCSRSRRPKKSNSTGRAGSILSRGAVSSTRSSANS
jgi:ATP-dependent helicase/nuclease subunit B